MKHSISSILFDESIINQRVCELAAQISKDYKDKSLVAISILKGSFMFLADLCRSLTIPVEIDFLAVSSYGAKAVSSGKILIKKEIDTNIEGKDVLVVEDIFDTGLTMTHVYEHLKNKNPASIKSCVLLDKKIANKKKIVIDYKGFDIEDDFVVGYGLDYAEQFRNLPYIGILKEEEYK